MAKRTDITGIVPVPQEPGHLFQCLVFPWLMGLSGREMADHCYFSGIIRNPKSSYIEIMN